MHKKRVVVTGIGCISPLGLDIQDTWSNAISGKSGISLIDSFDTSDFVTHFAGNVIGFDPSDYMPAKEIKKVDRFIQFGLGASRQAVEQSSLMSSKVDLERVGVCLASGIGGISMFQDCVNNLQKNGPRRLTPFYVPGLIINMLSGNVSIEYGFKGPNFSPVSACSSSNHSIGIAKRSIECGEADVMLCGGSEAPVNEVGLGSFNALRALSKNNEEFASASRPWSINRDGFVLGEGAATLVLESLEHAQNRGATILAELTGYAATADAYHITLPAENGDGGFRAMKLALEDASLDPEDISYINAHATSTPAGDLIELRSIKKLFGDNFAGKISGTKSMTGHLLGAAGGIEAIFSILAITHQQVPPTINLHHPEAELGNLDPVAHIGKSHSVKHVLSNSFGFGGTNASVVFSKV